MITENRPEGVKPHEKNGHAGSNGKAPAKAEPTNRIAAYVRNPALRKAGRQAIKDTRTTAPMPTEEQLGWLERELADEVAELEELFNPGRPYFPLWTFPPLIRKYVEAQAESIHCAPDLIAVPLLPVAGAAIGRSGRRLKVKDGWQVSSCLWAAVLSESGAGKTPALNASQNFYDDRQEVEHLGWQDRKDAHEADPENASKPGPYPALKLTDTTTESLRTDLVSGAVLFARDELGGWCHQMGQYKQGNADRFDWCSFWSHAAVNIGRKTERVFVKEPFVAVAGMMVPASACELNYRGQADDGFVHRMLLALVDAGRPVATLEGVPDNLTREFKSRMERLFNEPEPAGSKVLTFTEEALFSVMSWANEELYGRLYPLKNEAGEVVPHPMYPDTDPPGWLISKAKKLYENCLRLCLVLHELWRVAGDWQPAEEEQEPEAELTPDEVKAPRAVPGPDPMVVTVETVRRAIAVIKYFLSQVGSIQALMGEDVDEIDRTYRRFYKAGERVNVRYIVRSTSYKTADKVKALFAEWQRRGYGITEQSRKNRTEFKFHQDGE